MVRRELTREFGSLEVTHFSAGPDFRLQPHTHAGRHACYILEGGFWEGAEGQQDGGEELWCPAGSFRLSPPGDHHVIRFGRDGGRCLVLHFADPGASNGRYSESVERKLVRSDLLDDMLNLLHTILESDRHASLTALQAEVCRVFALAGLHARVDTAGAPAWLQHVRTRLAEQSPTKSGVTELAAEVEVHPVHLSRTFRRFFGTTPTGFARVCRLSWAYELVDVSSLSLSEIAYRTGYSDQAHMTRAFVRWLGCTPGRLRTMEGIGARFSGESG